MNRYVLTGRVFDGKRLIAIKITEIESLNSRFIPKNKLDKFFRDVQVINCMYKYGNLSLTDSKLDIKKFPRYNRNLRLPKSRFNREKYYTESQIIASAMNEDVDKVTYYICGALVSGGITDPLSRQASKHAEIYYNEIRSMTTDIHRIAANTGYSIHQIRTVKNYAFMDEHELADGTSRFAPCFEIAQSWQRLMSHNKNDIQPHDLLLIKHELYESTLVSQGHDQDTAHRMASEKYDYATASDNYYRSLMEKNKTRR